MNPRMRWPLGAAVLALLLGAMTTAASAGTMTYNDPAGDAQGGPDVTTVTINGDPATSTIKIAVTVPGYFPATADGLERDVFVSLDTDRSFATGDPDDGTEYSLGAWNDASGRWWDISRWNGSKWESIPESPTMSFTRTGDVITWTVNSSDMGGATGFRFYALSGIWNVTDEKWTARDEAPDGTGWWDFSLAGTTQESPPSTAPRVALLVSAPETTPKRPLAGKPFTVTFLARFQKEQEITSIDLATGETKTGMAVTWTPVPRGRIVGTASVGGKAIARGATFKTGDARLSFVVPKTAKGKMLQVKVKVTATEKDSGKTLSARKTATFRVR